MSHSSFSAALILLPLTLGACFDFAGEKKQIGFDSNLVVTAHQTWTPVHRIASGTRFQVTAVELIDTENDGPPAVSGAVRGDVDDLSIDGQSVSFTGWEQTRARVSYEGAAQDHFRVRFEPAVDARLDDPAFSLLGWDEPEQAIALVPGAQLALWPALLDERAEALGYDPDDLQLEVDGPVSAWLEDGAVHLVADGVRGEHALIELTHRGTTLATLPVQLADGRDLDSLELRTQILDDEDLEVDVVVAVAVGLLPDGARLHGLPIDWTWTAEDDVQRDDFEERTDVLILGSKELTEPIDLVAEVGGRVVKTEVRVKQRWWRR